MQKAVGVHHNYAEAIDQIGNGLLQCILLFVCGISLMCVNTESLSMGYVLRSAECDFPISVIAKGLINIAALFGIIISCHLWGFLSDTWGRQKVLRASLITTFIFSILSSFSVSAIMLLVFRFAAGFW